MATRTNNGQNRALKRTRQTKQTSKAFLDLYADRDRLIREYESQLTEFRMREGELRRDRAKAESASEYYAGLFNASPVGLLILDPVCVIKEASETAAKILGCKRERLIKESMARFFPKETLAAILNHFRVCKSTKGPVTGEFTLRNAEGALVPVEMVSECHITRPFHYRTVIMDISKRLSMEATMRETQRNFRNLVNAVEGIVWESAPGGANFTFVSHQAERILGYPTHRWIREPEFWADRIHVDDRERVARRREEAFATDQGFVIEFRAYDVNRRLIWLRNNVTVFHDETGRKKLRGVMVNITELKEKEQALREETTVLEELNRVGSILAAELDLNGLVSAVTDACVRVTGAMYGAFSYKTTEGGFERSCLYTTGGTPRELFSRLPLPEHRLNAPATEVGSETLRITDTLDDSRSPKPILQAHKKGREPVVRSYLAMPVVSRDGELLGGLLFGHAKPGVFTERSQRIVTAIAAQAAVALDNARLYTAMSQSESRLRQLADAMPQIVWTAEPDGTVDYFNWGWYEFTGQPDGKTDAGGWLAVVHPDDCKLCSGEWENAVRLGTAFQTECRLRKGNSNRYPWHLVRAIPVRDEKERTIKWFGTCTNIEDQKRAEAEVRDLNTSLEMRVEERTAELTASNKELEAFNYSVSHDLRAPLRSISAFSQLLKEDCPSALGQQCQDYLRIIGESAMHMSGLIDSLLYLSRISRGEIHRGQVNLSTLVKQAVDRLQQADTQRKVEVVIAGQLTASGDERLLQIAVDNLINNAWKFTSQKADARIEVGRETHGEKRVFYVRDNGAGFDMKYADKLFGTFTRLHSNDEFPGNGIGLAIVQRIIHRHGGQIWADGTVDQGATFYFTLPEE